MTPSPPVRSAQPSPSDLDLTVHGLRNLGPVFANLEPPALIELALARNEAILTDRGALVACTGTHTGRAARDRYLVAEPSFAIIPRPMSIPSEPPPASLSRRVVLLGASNVARGLSTLVETACRLWGRPLDLLAACGHGRSYGWRMSLLGRALPGIVDCGLWQALEQAPPAPTGALVTDVGNDILYDVPVDAIAAWVEACLGRLARAGARVVMTPLPLGNITTLSPARYLFFRRLLFPRCRLPYSAARERVLDLDGRLRALARSHGAHLAEHRPEWYGLDPIHIRRRHAAQAWRAILSPWADASPLPPPATGSLRRWLYVRRLPPDRRWLFGREQRRPQPAGRFADGSTLALY